MAKFSRIYCIAECAHSLTSNNIATTQLHDRNWWNESIHLIAGSNRSARRTFRSLIAILSEAKRDRAASWRQHLSQLSANVTKSAHLRGIWLGADDVTYPSLKLTWHRVGNVDPALHSCWLQWLS